MSYSSKLSINFAASSTILKYRFTPMEKFDDQRRPMPSAESLALSSLSYQPVVPMTKSTPASLQNFILSSTASPKEKSSATSAPEKTPSLRDGAVASAAFGSTTATILCPLSSAILCTAEPMEPYPISAKFILLVYILFCVLSTNKCLVFTDFLDKSPDITRGTRLEGVC